MNLEKAIELNKESERSLRTGKFYDHANAIKVGNEALKFRLELEQEDPEIELQPLPGETND